MFRPGQRMTRRGWMRAATGLEMARALGSGRRGPRAGGAVSLGEWGLLGSGTRRMLRLGMRRANAMRMRGTRAEFMSNAGFMPDARFMTGTGFMPGAGIAGEGLASAGSRRGLGSGGGRAIHMLGFDRELLAQQFLNRLEVRHFLNIAE